MSRGASGSKPVVLIVEDEPLIRWSAELALAEAGFSFLSAANAEEAIGWLERRDDIVIVFSDVAMPGERDGVVLAAMVRASRPHIGIVLTSGHFEKLPADIGPPARFLPKPYSDSELISAIAEVRETG
ncbi:response regulator [Reyranella sp.]|uniref:response regulator n=1 Tax=Reyranella sp. TaxID=1929291 RepID=UPI003BAC1B82